MATTDDSTITMDEFRAIVRRAGLDLTPAELEHLLPLYQQLMAQVAMLHDPELPLAGPAVNFAARWPG